MYKLNKSQQNVISDVEFYSTTNEPIVIGKSYTIKLGFILIKQFKVLNNDDECFAY